MSSLVQNNRIATAFIVGCFFYRFGACPCGCFEHNYWVQAIGIVGPEHDHAPTEGSVPTVTDQHHCSGAFAVDFVNDARLVKPPTTISNQSWSAFIEEDAPVTLPNEPGSQSTRGPPCFWTATSSHSELQVYILSRYLRTSTKFSSWHPRSLGRSHDRSGDEYIHEPTSFPMSSIARNVLVMATTLTLVFATGLLSGMYLVPGLIPNNSPEDLHDHDEHDHDSAGDSDHSHAEDHDHEEGEHIAISKQAFENLSLKLGPITLQDYWKSQSVPGEVVEIPGTSTLTISSPMNGVIESISVRPGEAVRSTDRLFSLRVTDDVLSTAQSNLLAGIARANIIRREVARLAPLTASAPSLDASNVILSTNSLNWTLRKVYCDRKCDREDCRMLSSRRLRKAGCWRVRWKSPLPMPEKRRSLQTGKGFDRSLTTTKPRRLSMRWNNC